LVEDSKTIVVQVNGKVRGKLTVAADADEASLRQAALEESNVARFLEGKTVRKVVVVPGRLVNIVAS
jgi:leucyl-tRNA synthetase